MDKGECDAVRRSRVGICRRWLGVIASLDSFDVVEGLVIEGGTEVRVLNGVSLHGGLVASWPMSKLNTTTILEALGEHWRAVGLPRFAQFDNDTLFQGNHQFADSIGRVIRLCLSLASNSSVCSSSGNRFSSRH